MKRYLVILATLGFILCIPKVSFAQTLDTNIPPVVDKFLGFLTQSNLYVATYGMYDTTSHKPGAGLGLGYRINDFVMTTIRLDAVVDPVDEKLAVYVPSGSLQLQLPLPAFGPIKVTPLTFVGVATSLNGDNGGEAIGIFGIGAAVAFPQAKSKLIPAGLIGDWERWTGGGFNNSQIRAGLYWKF